jgi:hypothetical protein
MTFTRKHEFRAKLLALPAAVVALGLLSVSAAFADLQPPAGGPPFPGAHWCSYCQGAQGGTEICDGKWCPEDKICGGTAYWDETTTPHTHWSRGQCVDRP